MLRIKRTSIAALIVGTLISLSASVHAAAVANWQTPSTDDTPEARTLPATDSRAVVMQYSDFDLLARLVSAEAQGEPVEGKVAVAAVVLHRLASPDYPKTIQDIIFERTYGFPQFSVVDNGTLDHPPTAESVKAVQYALAGWDPSRGSTGFYNPAFVKPTNWVAKQPKTVLIGGHQFYKSGSPIY